jgi:hypothetical protein
MDDRTLSLLDARGSASPTPEVYRLPALDLGGLFEH